MSFRRVYRFKNFDDWLRRISDPVTRARIVQRLDRLINGHQGSGRYLGYGVSELKIDFGPGYRIYYSTAGSDWLIF